MTLSQGMLSAKVPAGFGFPIASNEPLLLFTQVLNLNIEQAEQHQSAPSRDDRLRARP